MEINTLHNTAHILFATRRCDDQEGNLFNRSTVAPLFYRDSLFAKTHEQVTEILLADERITRLLKVAAETETIEELEAVLARAS